MLFYPCYVVRVFLWTYSEFTIRGPYTENISTASYVNSGLELELSGNYYDPEFFYAVDGMNYSTAYRLDSWWADSREISDSKDIKYFDIGNRTYNFSLVVSDMANKKIGRISGVISGGSVIYCAETLFDGGNGPIAYDIHLEEFHDNIVISFNPDIWVYAKQFMMFLALLFFLAIFLIADKD